MGEVALYPGILSALRALGCEATRLNAGRRGVRLAPKGWADFIACGPRGRFIAVEVKREGKDPTSEQIVWGYEVHRRGGLYLVVHGAEDVLMMAEAIRGRA